MIELIESTIRRNGGSNQINKITLSLLSTLSTLSSIPFVSRAREERGRSMWRRSKAQTQRLQAKANITATNTCVQRWRAGRQWQQNIFVSACRDAIVYTTRITYNRK